MTTPFPFLRRKTVFVACLLALASNIQAWSDEKGLKGEYFDSNTRQCVLTRTDATINFDWGTTAPDPKVQPNMYNVHWTGMLTPLYSEKYTITADVDDGVKLWVDGKQLIDAYDFQVGERSGTIDLTANKPVSIKIYYKQIDQKAHAKLYWSSTSQSKEIIPQSALSVSPALPVKIDGTEHFPALAVVNQHIDFRETDSDGAGTVTYTWSKISGPGKMIADKNNGTPLGWYETATFDTEGAYVVRLTVADQNGSTTQDMEVKVGPAITPGAVVYESSFQPGGKGSIYYVDGQANAASDSNPGTDPHAPLKTIGAAAAKGSADNSKGTPAKIVVSPGTYREAFVLSGGGAPLVIEGTAPGKVLISGATADGWDLSTWTKVADGIYKKAWPYKYGLIEPQGSTDVRRYPNIYLFRRELVVVNGVGVLPFQLEDISWVIDPKPTFTFHSYKDPLTDLPEGRFAINDQEDDGHPDCHTIFLHLPKGVDPSTAKIEVADDKITVTDRKNLVVINRGDVVFRNLDFGYSATVYNNCMVQLNTGAAGGPEENFEKNVLLENCQFNWSTAIGVGGGEIKNVTLRKCVCDHNKTGGIAPWPAVGVLFEDTESSYNCWGPGLCPDGWVPAGLKGLMRNCKFVRYKSDYNQNIGLWLDCGWTGDGAYNTYDDCEFNFNTNHGVLFEIARGPNVVTNCKMIGNGGSGLESSYGARESTVTNSVMIDNSGPNLKCVGQQGAKGLPDNICLTARNNIVEASKPSELAFAYDGWSTSHSVFSQNKYWSPAADKAFKRAWWDGDTDFATWQKNTGLDADSTWEAAPSVAKPTVSANN